MKKCTVRILQTQPLKLATLFVGRENYVSFFQTCMLVYYSFMNMFSYYHIWFIYFNKTFAKTSQCFIIQ